MHDSKGYMKIKTGVGANEKNEIKGVQQFAIELNDPHGPHFRLHCTVKCDVINWKPHARFKGVYED